MQLSTDTFCSCRENVWGLNRLIWRWPHSVTLWFKGSRGSSAHTWKRQSWWLAGSKLHWIKHESMEWESFGLYGLKKKESISCLLLQHAPHFKAIFKDIIPQAHTHEMVTVWVKKGQTTPREHSPDESRSQGSLNYPGRVLLVWCQESLEKNLTPDLCENRFPKKQQCEIFCRAQTFLCCHWQYYLK